VFIGKRFGWEGKDRREGKVEEEEANFPPLLSTTPLDVIKDFVGCNLE